MPRDGTGDYTLPGPQNPVITDTLITSDWANTTLDDIATALTQSISADGQTPITNNLPMSGYKHTNVGNASARTHYAAAGQVSDNSMATLNTVGGTANAITGLIIPAITGYVTGQTFVLVPTASNTGATTISVNGLTVQNIVKDNNVPLVANDLLIGVPAQLVYNGSAFNLVNPNVISSTSLTTVAIAQGGTGQTTQTAAFDALAPTTTLGDTVYHNGTDNVRLAGNTTTTREFLRQTGNGTISAAPVWDTVTKTDVGLSNVANVDTTNATNITSGTLDAARTPAYTGDATKSLGGSVLTLATVNGNTGTFGTVSAVPVFTVNGKGLITGVTNTSIAISAGAVSGLATSATTDTTNASNITSGTLAAGRLPAFTGDATAGGGSAALTIAANAVTNAKAAQMATNTIKGNNTGSTANATDLTATQVTAMLNVFTTTLQGLVPANGSSDTSKFLRSDGTWAAPNVGQSQTANGYYKFPGGLIVQWGFDTRSGSSAQTVTFPVAFTSACYAICSNPRRVGGDALGQIPTITAVPTTTSFQLAHADSSAGAFWIAVGV